MKKVSVVKLNQFAALRSGAADFGDIIAEINAAIVQLEKKYPGLTSDQDNKHDSEIISIIPDGAPTPAMLADFKALADGFVTKYPPMVETSGWNEKYGYFGIVVTPEELYEPVEPEQRLARRRPKTAASIKSMFTALSLLIKEIKPIAEEADAAGLKSASQFNKDLDKAIKSAQKCYDEAKKALVQHD